MIYTHVAASILAATLAATGAWKVQDWRYTAQITAMQQAHTAATLKAEQDARRQEQALQRTKDEAIAKANQRADANKAAAAAAVTDRDRLRAQLLSASVQLPNATVTSVRQYASTTSQLLAECIGSYQSVAEAADRNASDTRTLIDAWPR